VRYLLSAGAEPDDNRFAQHYLIRSLSYLYSFLSSYFNMPIDLKFLDEAIRVALPVSHLDIEDQSNGCGDSYAIVIVSEVASLSSPLDSHAELSLRCLTENLRLRVIVWVRDELGFCCTFDDYSPTVNDLLKDQIAQMHAFSQVIVQPNTCSLM